MSRIAGCFQDARQVGRKLLISYITAGDPGPDYTVPLMHAMVVAGADIIELGVPFSDPMAEGKVIQKAMERALQHNVTLDGVLAMVREFRQQNRHTPVVLMGYLNPVEVMGYAAFAEAGAEAGIDGVLLVDMPPEEASELVGQLRQKSLDMIFLVAPTTDSARIKIISAAASGFIYYVSLKGVTGAGHLDTNGVKQQVDKITAQTDIPVGVGFGIKDAATAATVSRMADAVVVGSALVSQIESAGESSEAINQAVSSLLGEMRQAMDAD